jgi:hypothetical protein
MSNEKEVSGYTFDKFISDVKRWSEVIGKTAEHILETSSNNKEKPKS